MFTPVTGPAAKKRPCRLSLTMPSFELAVEHFCWGMLFGCERHGNSAEFYSYFSNLQFAYLNFLVSLTSLKNSSLNKYAVYIIIIHGVSGQAKVSICLLAN